MSRTRSLGVLAACLPFLLALPGASTAESPSFPACAGVEARLAAIDPAVKTGTAPRFRLTLSNRTDAAAKLLDIRNGRRPDLEDAYYRLELSKDGAPVALSRVICDPGPLSDEDFFRLAPGAQERITLTVPCTDLTALPAGAYVARLVLVRDPLAGRDTRCASTEAVFEVRR